MEEKLKEKVEEQINNILEDGIQSSNLEALYKLVDIHKDLANVEYWKKEEEKMMRGYGDGSMGYGNYNMGGYSDGGYSGYGNYGRRGVPRNWQRQKKI